MWLHIYNIREYFSAIKKNEAMPFAATWMNQEIIIRSEVSQKEKDKYQVKSLLCGLYNREDFTYKTNILTVIENILVVV